MFCRECGKEISCEDKFCRWCGTSKEDEIKVKKSNISIQSKGDLIGSIITGDGATGVSQQININGNEEKQYDISKIDKKKIINVKSLEITAIITFLTSLTTLYLNIGKIKSEGLLSVGQNKNFSILTNITIVMVIITLLLFIFISDIKKKGIIQIKRYFINMTLVNIDNKVYKIRITESCSECKTEPKGSLNIKEENGKYYIECSKYPKHKFELDHTQF